MAEVTATGASVGERDPAADDASDRLPPGMTGVDLVRDHFIETLTRRLSTQRGPVRAVLERRLALAVRQTRQAAERAQHAVRHVAAPADARPSPLAELLTHVAQVSSPSAGDRDDGREARPAAAHGPDQHADTDLKSLRYFRDGWSRLSAEQQLAEALTQGPENAGPLNSHRLVLESLKRMRQLSPAYLTRFMAYADALLWLDLADGGARKKPAGGGDPEKKRRPGRAKAG